MARVKRALNAQKKRRVTLERAKGYRGQRARLYRKAKEQMLHSMTYAYRDRNERKGNFRRLWIQRINAAARANGLTYNRFHQDPQAAGAGGSRGQGVSGGVRRGVAQTVPARGLLAVCGLIDVPLATSTQRGPALVALLANLRGPGNAGTVVRADDAAGADAVIFSDG